MSRRGRRESRDRLVIQGLQAYRDQRRILHHSRPALWRRRVCRDFLALKDHKDPRGTMPFSLAL
jgi:hypothetical protein